MDNNTQYNIGNSKYQGLLVVMKNNDNNKLFIECTEINSQWDNPEDAIKDNLESNQSYTQTNLNEYKHSQYATWNEIRETGWDKYVVNKPLS